MRWFVLVAGLLLAPAVWAQGTNVQPPVGSVWTYLGPTYGASWATTPFGTGPAPPADNNWLAKWLPGGGLGSAYSPSNQGNLVGSFIDTVPPGLWGPHIFHAGSFGGNNTAVFAKEMNVPTPTFAFPSALSGYGKLAAVSAGNVVFGVYGLAELYANTGSVVAAEFTARNWVGPSGVDTFLPPDSAIPNSTKNLRGINVTCGSLGLGDCSIGIHIGNETGVAADHVWNTGAYIQLYRQYGLVVDAMPTGNQTSALFKNNGGGIGLQLQSTAVGNPNAALTVVNAQGPQAGFDWRGRLAVRQLLATEHASLGPVLSACGSGAGLGTNASDTSGTISVGTGVTSCTLTFGTAYLVAPVCVTSALNTSVSFTAVGTTGFTLGSGSLASAVVNYICLPQGG